MRAYLQSPNDPNNPVAVTAELRVSYGEIQSDNSTIDVSLTALTLAVDPRGFDPEAGVRFGEPMRQNVVEHKHTTTTVSQQSGSLTAKIATRFGITGLRAEASASASADLGGKLERKITFTETIKTQKVEARPNLKWEVREPDSSPLRATYLANDTLCSLNLRPGANEIGVTVRVSVKQRDIVFGGSRLDQLKSNTNKTREKLLNIFLAKAISHDPNYGGKILLSQVDIESDE